MRRQVSLDEAITIYEDRSAEIIALDDALRSLAEIDPLNGRFVELRFFGSFSVKETAKALDMSQRNVARDWDFALAWLYRELAHGGSKDKE